jgi:hypothetical protein
MSLAGRFAFKIEAKVCPALKEQAAEPVLERFSTGRDRPMIKQQALS